MIRTFRLIVLFICTLFVNTGLAQEDTVAFSSAAPTAILIDAKTGEVFYEKDADRPVPPASMSKLMTQLLIFDQLKSGKLTEEQELLISEDAWRRGGGVSGSSTMYAEVNSKVSVINLLRGSIIQSANDACIALAEGVAGTEAAFVSMLNEKAKVLGLKNSVLANSTGLPDPSHVMSMRDLANVARHIFLEHPKYFKIYSEPSFTWNKIEQKNRNPLLADIKGSDGMKTGYTKESGYGLVGTADRDGRRLIMVVGGLTSINERRNEASKLLEWGYRQFKPFEVYDEEVVVSTARVWGGESRWVDLKTKTPFKVALSPREQATVEVKLDYSGPLMAPIKKDIQVGIVRILAGGNTIAEHPVFTGNDVAEVKTMWKRAMDSLMIIVMGG